MMFKKKQKKQIMQVKWREKKYTTRPYGGGTRLTYCCSFQEFKPVWVGEGSVTVPCPKLFTVGGIL